MSKVVTKLAHEPFRLNHAVIISIIVHAVFLSTQPLSFLDKPPVLKKQYKECCHEIFYALELAKLKRLFENFLCLEILPKYWLVLIFCRKFCISC